LTERVLQSASFRRSQKLSAFLRYVVDRSISNLEAEISEQQIGIHVFGRAPGYNPGDDNVVRSQARLLRAKLEAHFSTEGASEDLRILIPKGSYVPVFETAAKLTAIVPDPALETIAKPWRRSPSLYLLAGLSLGVALTFWLRPTADTATQEPAAYHEFWNSILAQDQAVTIVAPDQALAITSEVLGRQFNLADYLTRSPHAEWTKRDLDATSLRQLPTRNYTMMDAVSIAARVAELAGRRGRSVVIRFAREVNRRELSNGPLILLGTASANPWIELFEPKHNFTYSLAQGRRPHILLNRRPLATEPPEFRQKSVEGMHEGFSTLSFRSGLNGKSPVLILGGMSMEATEAGASLVLAPGLFGKHIAPLLTRDNPYIEIVVRSRNLAGTATAPEKLAHRSYPD